MHILCILTIVLSCHRLMHKFHEYFGGTDVVLFDRIFSLFLPAMILQKTKTHKSHISQIMIQLKGLIWNVKVFLDNIFWLSIKPAVLYFVVNYLLLFLKTEAAARKRCKKCNPLCLVNRWRVSAGMNASGVNLFFMRENSSKRNSFIWNVKHSVARK